MGALLFIGFIALAIVAWVWKRGLSDRLDQASQQIMRVNTRLDQLTEDLRRLERRAIEPEEPEQEPVELEEKAEEPPEVAPTPPPLPKAVEIPVEAEEPEEGLVAAEAGIPQFEATPFAASGSSPAGPAREHVAAPQVVSAPPAPPGPNSVDLALEYLKKQLKKIGPDDPNMGWEMALGTYWLPRIGVLALSISIVFLLTLAAQKFGPPPPEVRVGIAYAVCGALLFFGRRLEAKYAQFARVLYGGGIAGSYFVTFATHYVPFARIFESPVPSLLLLALIVVAWAGVAQKRRSPTVAVLVTFLGHLTIGLATFSVDNPAQYTSVGIVLLSLGSAFFLLRNRWYYVASLGAAGSYLNHFLLMSQSETPDEVMSFAVGMAVLTIYFVIFAGAELFAPERLRRESVPVWFRTGLVTMNTACFFGLGTLVVNSFTFMEGREHLFPYILAVGLIALSLAYQRLRRGDPLYNAYMTKGFAVLTWGLAVQFDGNTLTAWLAVEVVVLLVSAWRSGLVVTRVLAFAVAVAAFGHGLFSASEMAAIPYSTEGYVGALVQTVISVLAFLAASQIYQRVDWERRSPGTLPFSHQTLLELWQLDLAARPESASEDAKKPLEGLLLPYLYGLGGSVLFMAYSARLVELSDRGFVVTLVALLLGGAAIFRKAPPFGLGSVLVLLTGFVWMLYDTNTHGAWRYVDEHYAGACARAGVMLLGFLVFSEMVRRASVRDDDSALGTFPHLSYAGTEGSSSSRRLSEAPAGERVSLLPYGVTLAAVVLLLTFSWRLVESSDRALVVTLAALLLGGAAIFRKAPPFGLGSVLVLLAGFVWALHDANAHGVWHYVDEHYAGACARAGVTLLGFLVFGEMVRRVFVHDEHSFFGTFPHFGYIGTEGPLISWRLQAEATEGEGESQLPFTAMLGAVLLLVAFSFGLAEEGHRTLPLSVGALIFVGVAWVLRALPFAAGSLCMVVAAFLVGTVEASDTMPMGVAIPSLAVLFAVALFSEKRLLGERQSMALHQFPASPYVLYGVVAWIIALYLTESLESFWRVFGLTVAALVSAGLVNFLHRRALAYVSTAFLLWALFLWWFDSPELAGWQAPVAAWMLMGSAIAGERYYAFSKQAILRPILVVAAWLAVTRYVYVELDLQWVSFFWVVANAAFLAYGLGLRLRAAGVVALGGVVMASLFHVAYAYDEPVESLRILSLISGFVAPVVFWVVCERLYRFASSKFEFEFGWPASGVFVGLAAGLMVIMLERIPALSEFYLTVSWSILALALFGLSLGFHEKVYRYAGLLILLLASGRVVLFDTRNLELMPRVVAWAVLGVILLLLGYGYVKAFSGGATRPAVSRVK